MSESDIERLVVAGEQTETQSVQGENEPQGDEEDDDATQMTSEGNTTVEATQEDSEKTAEDDGWRRGESGTSSSGSSTPSITTYDVGAPELQEVTVQIAEQETIRREDSQAREEKEIHKERQEKKQDSEAAEKLKQPSEDTESDVQTRDIVVEMDTFNRSSTRRGSFMLAMQNDETVGAAEDVPVLGEGRNGKSGAPGANGASSQEKADAQDISDDQRADNIAGSSQGFQMMEIFTDDDLDTVRDKWRRRLQCSWRGRWLCCVCVAGVMAAVLTAVLVPVSLVYVEYHEIALARSKLTGRVDRSQTIYPGCHLLFPDTELIRFKATAHLLRVDAHISSSEGLALRLRLALQYFIKPEELGELHQKFAEKYEGVIWSVISSQVRNSAVHLSLHHYRQDRARVHQYLHRHLADRLQGNCCAPCCPSHCRVSQQYVGHNCSTCSKKPDCHSGFHVTLQPQHLQILTLQLPSNLTERYLRLTLLQVETEKELFVQEYKVEQKRTEKLVKDIQNKGREVLGVAEAEGRRVSLVAAAEAEKTRQQGFTLAMGHLFTALNITSTQRRLSLVNTLALRDLSENFSLHQFDRLTVV